MIMWERYLCCYSVSFSYNHLLSFVKCIAFCLVPDCRTSLRFLFCFVCICVLCIFGVSWSQMHLEAEKSENMQTLPRLDTTISCLLHSILGSVFLNISNIIQIFNLFSVCFVMPCLWPAHVLLLFSSFCRIHCPLVVDWRGSLEP